MAKYVITADDVAALWRPLQPDEMERVKALIPVVLDSLRLEAQKVGKDLDQLAEDSGIFASVLKSVAVDVIARTLMTATDKEPVMQSTESALGYSVSNTYLVPGGGLFIKRTELARLGLMRQRYGVIDLYGIDQGNNGNAL